jgi:hypothetical protein
MAIDAEIDAAAKSHVLILKIIPGYSKSSFEKTSSQE